MRITYTGNVESQAFCKLSDLVKDVCVCTYGQQMKKTDFGMCYCDLTKGGFSIGTPLKMNKLVEDLKFFVLPEINIFRILYTIYTLENTPMVISEHSD